MLIVRSRKLLSFAVLFATQSFVSAQVVSTTRELPRNLGGGLRELVELHRSRPAGMLRLNLRNKTVAIHSSSSRPRLAESRERGIVSDRGGRVLVTVILNGTESASVVQRSLTAMGGSVVAEDAAQPDTLSAFLLLDSAAAFATSPGVSAIKLSRKPVHNVGAVTSQGVQLIHSDQVNATGMTGQGITIGIISDSFDGVTVALQASDDVASGDLPNIGVLDGRPGLKFLSDGAGENFGDADEGRAMAQVAYDVAPGISLCFASSDFGITSFAKYIRRLRTDSSCLADVLVDDTMYLDEPMFSDGAIAKAIDDVVTSDVLAGRKVAYFSAAGNAGQGGFASDVRFVTDADARGLSNAGINLKAVPSRIDTSGGFHNFNAGSGTPVLYQTVTLTGSGTTTFVLQWDDLFDQTPSAISTDLNLLVFDGQGRFVGDLSDDNFSTDEPIEIGDLDSGTYRLAIARTGRGTHLAARVRYVALTPSDGSISGDFINAQQPTIYGHAAARSAQAVGAYNFDTGVNSSTFTPGLESYSSAGPVTISFDATGNRLATPEVRRKPDFAAPDCVNTTFFFTADTNDNYFSFCGTSAAAPHAAAAAALLLQSAGGAGFAFEREYSGKAASFAGGPRHRPILQPSGAEKCRCKRHRDGNRRRFDGFGF